MGTVFTISKLKEQIKPRIISSPYQVLRADPRTTTTKERSKARKAIQQLKFENFNKHRATKALDPITFDEFKKYEEEKNKAEEPFIIQNNARQMNLEDKQNNNWEFFTKKLRISITGAITNE